MNINSKKMFNKIYLEISNVCNLQCSFCPPVERSKKSLDVASFEKIIEQISHLTERICLHVMGEPLNHPNFEELITAANKKNASIEVTTNATLLNSKNSSALLNTCVKQVNFSLQSFIDNFRSASPEFYFDKILKFCSQAQILRPDLYVNFRLWNINDPNLEHLNIFFFEKLEEFFSVKINRKIEVGLIKSKKISERFYLHFDSRFDWPDINAPIISKVGTCYGARQQLAIHADGTVVPCCLDKEANISLGNVFSDSIEDILKTERFTKIRDGFKKNCLVEDLCMRCTFAQRFSLN